MKDSQFLVSLFIWNKKEKFLKKNEFFFKKILDIFTEREYNIRGREGKGREGKGREGKGNPPNRAVYPGGRKTGRIL